MTTNKYFVIPMSYITHDVDLTLSFLTEAVLASVVCMVTPAVSDGEA